MRDFAWLLRNYQDGVLNYFKMKVTNGIVEGLNYIASNSVFLGPAPRPHQLHKRHLSRKLRNVRILRKAIFFKS